MAGEYPRKCKGRHGPHTIEGPEDEVQANSRNREYLTCRECRKINRRDHYRRYFDRHPEQYFKQVSRTSARARYKSELTQEAKLYG